MLQSLRNVSTSPRQCYAVRAASTLSSRKSAKSRISPELVAIDRSLKSLVKIAGHGDRLAGFTHTKKRNAEKKRLEDALATSANVRRSNSPQDIVFYEGQDNALSLEDLIESLQPESSGISPGSFVEVRRDGIANHGVVLANVLLSGRTNILALMTTGEIIGYRASDAMFVVPNFVDNDMVARCGADVLIPTAHETAARLSVLKRAKDFERAVETASNGVAQNIHSLYPRVAAADPEAWGEISTIGAAHILGGPSDVPILRLFAVHKQLMQRNEEFVAHPTAHLQRHTFTVRPRAHLENMQIVRRWIREGVSSPFPAFVKKAKKIVQYSRRERSDEGMPRVIHGALSPKFSSAELQIIKFMQRALRVTRIIQPDPYLTSIPLIVKAIDPIIDEIDNEVVQRLLTEMGVFSPWQDVITDLCDTYHYGPVQANDQGKSTDKQQITTTDQFKLPALDPHHALRHDFGNLPVFVLDDATAEELDDGISLEPVAGEPESFKIHVHVADPTALIPVQSDLAKLARKQMETLYYVHRSWPLLPSSNMIPDLNPKRLENGEGRNVLTFTFKVDAKGNLSDATVRAGIVRNLITIAYDDVDVLLGFNPERVYTRPFESPSINTIESKDLSYLHPHVLNLKLLHEVSQRLTRNRLAKSTFAYSQSVAQIGMTPRPPLSHPLGIDKPMIYSGFPQLRYSVYHPELGDTGSRALVAEFMKAAGRCASRFALQNDVPLIRKAVDRWQFSSEDVMDEILKHRTDNGYVDVRTILKSGYLAKPARYTLEPEGHWLMGIEQGEGYTRATSPLRRFPDMVVHWQIKAILKGEEPPFSRNDLTDLIGRITQFEAEHKRVTRTHERYWALMYIRRFMEQNSSERTRRAHDPVRNLDAYVMQVSAKNSIINVYQTDVFIPTLGLVAELQTEKNMNWTPGDPVVVNIKNIRLGLSPRLTVELA